MTFARLKRAVMANALLNPHLHGERGTFVLADGTSVPASVHVDAAQQRDVDQGTADRIERLKVLVNRDRSEAETLGPDGNAIGCIDHPQPGLRFFRAGDTDPRPFTWTGEIEGVRDYKWRLVFERRRRERQGLRQ